MSDYRSNKTCAEIDAILDSATPKGEVGDAPDVLTLQGARSYAKALSKASLICAGRITALYTTGWATIGAEVEIYDAFKVKYGDNAPTITKVVLVDKRVIDGTGESTTRFLFSGDYEGCYFVMGDFEGNDTVFDLGATKGDWIIAQNMRWSKIVTTRRDIAGIKGEVTAEALAQKLSTPTSTNTDPLAKQSLLEDFVRKVEGKGLSTEDFTTLLKQKLESLQNYDDTAINKAMGGVLELVNDFNQDIATLYNTKQDSCYILPFDLVDLTRVVDGELDAVAFTPDLFDAIQENRLILLPKVVDEPNGYQAVTQANYYADDVEMYLTIVAIEYDIRISGIFNDGNYLLTSSNIVLIPKQKPITDLDAIREGASRGATSVQGVKLNGSTITRKDENGIVDLGNIEGGGEKTSEEEISKMGFTKNKGTVTQVAGVAPDEDGHISAEELSKKLEIGSDASTSVNFANDLTGVPEATEEMFTYRPSAGDKSVRDESAVIRRIKGNTSVWGQKLKLALDQTGNNGWWFRDPNSGGDVRMDGNIIKYDVIPEKGSNQQISQYVGDLIVGHSYLLLFSFNNNGVVNDYYHRPWSVLFSNNLYGTESVNIFAPLNSASNGDVALFKTITREGFKAVILKQPYVNLSNDEIVPTTMEWSNIQLFDLTQMFGDGNEPTTIEEFRQYYPDVYYPYCAPEVRSMRATGIGTIGFNAFNGEYAEVIGGQAYYLGGAIDTAHFATKKGGELEEITIPENRLYTPSTNGYIYATGSDICINLSHSGVRNGEYEEYEKNTLLLPEIAKYFPNGMHGIGDVYDEINEEMAIQRCAVRTYEDGDENNAEVKTDKITTVYKLSEPIYTSIDEPLQLSYKVDDFGTEKMLSDIPSTPFKADIVYQFNAEGRIRDNSRNIERLEEQLQRTKEYIDTAIANTITTTLNTPV